MNANEDYHENERVRGHRTESFETVSNDTESTAGPEI